MTNSAEFLTRNGLNLFAVFDCQELAQDLQDQLLNEGIAITKYPRLVLLGNGGGSIWTHIQETNLSGANPVDDYSVMVAEEFMATYWGNAPSLMLYPGPVTVSLMRLGDLAGWGHQSPLGLGINPEYGLWFAYRVAFVTAAMIPATSPLSSQHPCHSCRDKPCITACPVSAVSAEDPFNISTCYEFRISDNSPCVDRCLARLACPVGRQYHYSTEQMQHHYELKRRV